MTVRYRHLRNYNLDGTVSQYGGSTICTVYDDETQQVSIGYSLCHECDTFNRKLGRTISHGRAMKRLREVMT